ncbi:MAG TPA: bifunctional 3,4-dihydroxy-2-butanone-4-phosphate synthase/GTP cyclohydrolase II [Polyangia bacterium]|nr:bifunctional 3,4-dihydroxy-2-butanone-4-phosphate synthase/GTP cyclohydrolase II [Polyangia bacterium]
MILARVEDAIAAVARGEMIVVVDDEERENEGDLVMAAEAATPEALAFMVRHTSGVVCAALTGDRLSELQLPLMVADNDESQGTAFTVTVDYRHGTTTGISAADRAATLRALADPGSLARDFARPGHVFPLRARSGGVLQRRGHTEATVDLARAAGFAPCGVLCELVNDDGTMSRPRDLSAFAERHHLALISIADLVAYRRRTERLVAAVAEARLPTRHGLFSARIYRDHGGTEHVALVMGEPRDAESVLVRVHSECLTGDVFGSLRCDCGAQLDAALARVAAEGCGVVVYLRGHEGRGVGLTSKMHAYKLQDQGRDTVEANLDLGLPIDARSYDVGAQILTDLGVTRLRLMSNNPAKFIELEGYDLRIVSRVPLLIAPNDENIGYLRTKQLKLGHELEIA